MPKVSIIIPALDETKNLPGVLDDLVGTLHRAGWDDTEVIVVAGTMADRRAAEVNYGRPWPQVYSVGQTRTGKGNALACGFFKATGEYIVMMDADGSHQSNDVVRMLEQLDQGAEFVKASRFMEGGGSDDFTHLRRFGAWVLTGLMNLLFSTKHTDLCYGLMAFHVSTLDVLHLPSVSIFEAQWGDGFEVETLINCRMARIEAATVEIPSVERARRSGTTHLRTFRDGWRVLRTLVSEHQRPRMFIRPVRRGRAA